MNAGPALRDIHLPPEPSWWPPAPGWWLLAALSAIALVIAGRWLHQYWRRRRQRRVLQALIDGLLQSDATPAQQLASLSEGLRRAAHRFDPRAASLAGEDWLRFLDGDDPARPFSAGPGRILTEGPFRPVTAAEAVAALRPLARRRLCALLDDRPIRQRLARTGGGRLAAFASLDRTRNKLFGRPSPTGGRRERDATDGRGRRSGQP